MDLSSMETFLKKIEDDRKINLQAQEEKEKERLKYQQERHSQMLVELGLEKLIPCSLKTRNATSYAYGLPTKRFYKNYWGKQKFPPFELMSEEEVEKLRRLGLTEPKEAIASSQQVSSTKETIALQQPVTSVEVRSPQKKPPQVSKAFSVLDPETQFEKKFPALKFSDLVEFETRILNNHSYYYDVEHGFYFSYDRTLGVFRALEPNEAIKLDLERDFAQHASSHHLPPQEILIDERSTPPSPTQTDNIKRKCQAAFPWINFDDDMMLLVSPDKCMYYYDRKRREYYRYDVSETFKILNHNQVLSSGVDCFAPFLASKTSDHCQNTKNFGQHVNKNENQMASRPTQKQIDAFVQSVSRELRSRLFRSYWKGDWNELLLKPRPELKSKQSLVERYGLRTYLTTFCISDFDEEISVALCKYVQQNEPAEFVSRLLSGGQHYLEPLIQMTNEATDEKVTQTITELRKCDL